MCDDVSIWILKSYKNGKESKQDRSKVDRATSPRLIVYECAAASVWNGAMGFPLPPSSLSIVQGNLVIRTRGFRRGFQDREGGRLGGLRGLD